MAGDNGVRIKPNDIVLSNVSFKHLSDPEKRLLLAVGFDRVRIVMDSPDPAARREAELDLAKRFLEEPV